MFGRLADNNAMAQILYGLALRFAVHFYLRNGDPVGLLTQSVADMAGAPSQTPVWELPIYHKQRQIPQP